MSLRSFILVVKFLLPLSLYLTQVPAQAQYFTGAAALGVGGAGVASNEQSESSLLNPAALAHSKDLSVGLFYRDGDLVRGEHDTLLGLNLVDNNKDVFFPASFAYFQRHRSFPGPVESLDEEYFQVSVGNFVWQQLSFGLSVIHLITEDESGDDYTQWDGVLGLHWNPIGDLALGLVYSHFATPDEDIPEYARLLAQWSMGVTYIATEFFRFKADLLRPDNQNPGQELIYRLGGESFLNDFLILRIGFDEDRFRDRSSWTLGLSFAGPRFHIDYAFKHRQGDESSALHSVDLRSPF